MKNRRTLSQSLQTNNLSEAAIAFVNGSAPQSRETNGNSHHSESMDDDAVTAAEAEPSADSPFPGTVSMSFRLPAELSARLLRASLDRKLKREKPFTQQDIIAEALAHWLKKRGDSL